MLRRAALFVSLALITVLARPAMAADGADLAIAVIDVTDPVEIGDELRFTATITNTGTAEAPDARLSWSLSHSKLRQAIRDGVPCPASPDGESSCLLGALAPAASKIVEIYATANALAAGIQTSSFTAYQGGASGPETVPDDNNASVATTLTAPAVGAWKRQTFRGYAPGARVGASVVTEEGSGRTYLVGGATVNGEDFVPTAETAEWDRGVWRQTGSGALPPRAFAHAAEGPDSVPLLFGGLGAAGPLGDTWKWDIGRAEWRQLLPLGATPPARSFGGMTWANGSILLFGGIDAGGNDLGDTWLWDGTRWEKLAISGPSPRNSFALAQDRIGKTVVLFGGCCTSTGDELGDTWLFHAEQRRWEKVSTPVSPSPREGASAAWSRPLSGVALFGGMNNDGMDLNDLWVWNGKAWSQETTTALPPARDGAAFTFSPHTGVEPGRFLLFGGWDDDATPLGDVHTIALPSRARFTASQRELSFGGEIIGLSRRLGFSLQNEGFGEGTVGAPSITGTYAADYAVSRNSCTSGVAAYRSCEIEVTFSPRGATASRRATLTIPTSSGPMSVGLNGNGYLITARTPGLITSKSVNHTFPVSWGPLGGVTAYDVEWTERTRSSSGAYVQGPWRRWKSQTTSTGAWFGGASQPPSIPGHTYLFRARGRTSSGLGPWGPVTSAIVPVDDRSNWLSWSGSWTNVSASGRYFSTLRQTTSVATMTLSTDTNQFSIVFEQCSICGRFKVYVDNAHVATIDQRGYTPPRGAVWVRYLPGGIRRHTLKIVTEKTAGRPTVKIDAIGLAR